MANDVRIGVRAKSISVVRSLTKTFRSGAVLAVLGLGAVLPNTKLQAQCTPNVGIGTNSPNASALLELYSTSMGLLIPRMTTSQRNLIPTPATSLLIFDVTQNGFWYYDGTNWVPFTAGWQLLGNSGTVDNVNFLGTIDNVALNFRVNNQRAFRIEPNVASPNIIGGFSGNFDITGLRGVTISGGGVSGLVNQATSSFSTIGGGANNIVGDNLGPTSSNTYATVSGGQSNIAQGGFSSIVGGANNLTEVYYSSVAGGTGNDARAVSQTVVGQYNDPQGICSCNSFNPLNLAFIVGGGLNDPQRYNSMTVDFRGVLTLGEAGINSSFSAIPEMRITGSTSGYVGFKASASTTSHTYTMPAAQGAAKSVLTNDGTGVLSWNAPATTTMAKYAVTTLAGFLGTVSNLALDTTKSVFRISAAAPQTLNSLADTADGRYITLMNVGVSAITLANQTGATPEYRIITGSGAPVPVSGDRSAVLIYDGTTKRWRLIDKTP
jgi:hypothetical protein